MMVIGPARLRRALLAATWLAGTALATLIVYEAVSAVAVEVTEQRPEPLSRAAVERALAEPSPSLGSGSSPTGAPSPAASASTPAPSPPPAKPPAGGGGVSTPIPSNPSTNTRTFALVGGTASLTCNGGQLALNWATPNSGFWVDTGSSDGGAQIEVRFRSDTHESQLQAWCSGGVVQGSVQEQTS